MKTKDEPRIVGRRRLIQALGTGGTAVALSKWAKPVVDSVIVPLHAQASGIPGTLYAISGSGGAASTLYTLNPATGAVASTIGPAGFDHITGIAFHPSSGVLYAVQSPGSGSVLLTIDPSTGTADVIGPTTLDQVPDITFSPAGTLFGWIEPSDDDLATFNLTTGEGTIVGDFGSGTASTGLAFNSTGTLYMKDGNDLYVIDPATGLAIGGSVTTGDLDNALAFGPGDVLYSLQRNGDSGMSLYTIVPGTGATTLVGSNALTNISAIAFR